MKRYILLALLCFTILLTACSQGIEDTEDYVGIIGEGKFLGYSYTVTKEKSSYEWEIGYKENQLLIIENTTNAADLESFRTSVNDGGVAFSTLMVWSIYFLIIVISTLVFFKKNKKELKRGGAIIVVFAAIAIYFSIDALTDLNFAVKEARYYYFTLK